MFAIFRAHLKLALRSLWPWTITVAVGGLSWLLVRYSPGIAAAISTLQSSIMPLFILGQMLATVALTQQEKSSRATELFEALPYRPAAWVAGRFAALYAVWLAAGTILWTFVLYIAPRGDLNAGSLGMWVWLLTLPVTLLFTIGLPMAVGHFLKRGFAPYVATLALFLATSFSGLQFLSLLWMALGRGGPATNADITLTQHFPLAQGDLFPNAALLVWNRLNAAAFGVGALALIAWTLSRRRRDPAGPWIGRAALAALLAIVIANGGASHIGLQRVGAMTIEKTLRDQPRPDTLTSLPAPAVSRYQVSLRLQGDSAGLSGVARVDLPSPSETAVFTLNQLFRVSAVVGPNGAPLAFSHQGDLLTISTQGQPGTYSVTYQGSVGQWRRDNWNGLRLAAHVTPRSVMLPVSLGWYPMPGFHTLTHREPKHMLEDSGVVHPPAPLELDVAGPEGLYFVSNAEGGVPVRSAWLIGTPWAPQEVSGIRFWAGPRQGRSVKEFAAQYAAEVGDLQRMIPVDQPFRVIEVSDTLWAVQADVPPQGFPGAMVVSASSFGDLKEEAIRSSMLTHWWSNSRTEEERQIHDVLRLFTADARSRAAQRPGGPMSTWTAAGRPFGAKTPDGQTLLADLQGFSKSRGIDATAAVLRALHEAEGPLTYQQVREALAGS